MDEIPRAPGKTSPATLTKPDAVSISKKYSTFLRITPQDRKLMIRHRDVMARCNSSFVHIFSNYLLAFPPTNEVLQQLTQNGSDTEQLLSTQIAHFLDFLNADSSTGYLKNLVRAGEIHHRHGVDSAWGMGACYLYLEHFCSIIHAAESGISAAECGELEGVVSKYLFRDMGLILAGYWNSNVVELDTEKQKITNLQEQVSSLLANLPQALWSVDVRNNSLIYASPAMLEICPEVEIPIPCHRWTAPEERAPVELAWQRALDGEKTEIETQLYMPDHHTHWFRRQFHPYKDKDGQVVRIDGIMEDITGAKDTLKRLEHLANTDTLTGLANRTLWHDRFTHAIASAKRSSKPVVLIILDLDHFKIINDTLGHPSGDKILQQAASRMREVLRDSDTLARLGGDEFAILLTEVDDTKMACKNVLKKILACLKEPFYLKDADEIYLGASIGVAFYPDHGKDADTLFSHADIAMYTAKRNHVHYTIYDPDYDETASGEFKLSGRLRKSLDHHELSLDYQPKIDMESGRVCGIEALLRWQHPHIGTISPEKFIPIAEQNGMIAPITKWVLHTALMQEQIWLQAGLNQRIAVNVSARSFQNPKLVEHIQSGLKLANLPGECLEIEITENTLMTDMEHGKEILMQLSKLGVHISLDDFGTGYSSLAYLKKLPIDTVKIDKSFVMDMTSNESDGVIVHSIICLGQRLGMTVIAEGVENQATWDLLREWGCNAAQGYHISRPTDSGGMSDWLSQTTSH